MRRNFVFIPSGKLVLSKDHEVIIKEFHIQATHVTQAQWKMVMGKNPSYFRNKSNPNPVESISWDDAKEFIKRLNDTQVCENKFRLPTEAEWEYACRAGSKSTYYFGDAPDELKDYAWFCKNSDQKTHPVGLKKPNKWGLYDMHGNVWEWVEDDWHSNYLDIPKDGSAWTDPLRGENKVLRGGSWGDDARHCRSASRLSDSPGNRSVNLGFRLVLQ